MKKKGFQEAAKEVLGQLGEDIHAMMCSPEHFDINHETLEVIPDGVKFNLKKNSIGITSAEITSTSTNTFTTKLFRKAG